MKQTDAMNISGTISNQMSILELFGKDTLEHLQQIISNVTGLGVITSDYKGTPLTEMTAFSPFCQCIRKKSEQLLICNLSDAFGIARSAVTQKACIYKCPCGLMEMAIPIIIDGQFLGGFLAGQVVCPDAPEEITQFDSLVKTEPYDDNEEKLHQQIPEMAYDKFSYIAELVFHIINMLAEKTMAERKASSNTSMENSMLKSQINRLEYKNALLELQLQQVKAQTHPLLLHHIINDIANLALVEDARETNQMILTYHNYMHRIFETKTEVSSLHTELENLEQYLKLYTYSRKEKIKLTYNIKKEFRLQRIPSHVVIPLIEKAIFPFADGSYDRMDITISAWHQDNTFYLKIFSAYTPNGYAPISEASGRSDGTSYIHKNDVTLHQKLELFFGDQYDLQEHQYSNHEADIILKYPMYFKAPTI